MMQYVGDVNIEHGGYFYDLAGWSDGYADVVRVTPCSDGGGQNNAWWVEALTVIRPRDKTELRTVLSVLGMTSMDLQAETRKAMVLAACMAYGLYDPANTFPRSQSEVVQIGKVADQHHADGAVAPSVVLRSNASLRRYVERFIKERF